jgi:hypothetical protein
LFGGGIVTVDGSARLTTAPKDEGESGWSQRGAVVEIMRLHDEAFRAAVEIEGCHKSSEGQITLHLTNTFERQDGEGPLTVKAVEVYAYVVGPSRSHHFESLDEALTTVRKWHAETMEWVRAYKAGEVEAP